MRVVLLIAVLAGCARTSAPATPSPAEAPPASAAPETLWDSGTFITVDKEVVLAGMEESFEIYRTADGYRISVRWKRPAPTGEPSDGEAVLVTDADFRPLQGSMMSTLHAARDEITRSTLQREPDGRLTTEVLAADGSKETAASNQPNDWFIGGSLTSFLIALCHAHDSVNAPLVYPDKATSLGPHKALPIDGTERVVTSRILVYEQSRRQVIAACENGKLAGEVARGTTIVRKDDLALARVLEKWFR
jgi:hypothetical protein